MDAVVLAAGASTRMGTPKALLRRHGATFLARVCEQARASGAGRVIVVVAPPHEDLVRAEAERLGAELVRNPRPERGQVSSMALGLEAARGAQALVALVDIPDWSAQTALRLRGDACFVHVPTYRGERGHPIVVPMSALRNAAPGETARDVFERVGVIEHPVDDPGILLDVDTPDDYARLT